MSELVSVRQGDLFASRAQALVNTVNCVGVMGKGIALEFRNRYPAMYQDYLRRCRRGQVKLGQPYLYRDLVTPPIINFPTKQHWRSVSRLEDIVAGLSYLESHVQEWRIESLAVPPLGCGNGGLEWSVVGPTLYRRLSRLAMPVELYAPHEATPLELTHEYLAGRQTDTMAVRTGHLSPASIAIAEIVDRVSKQRYHFTVGRVMLQKIAYFATVFGIPTGLKYGRGSFGPFSPDLKPVLTKLVNNGVLTEKSTGSLIEVQLGRAWQDACEAYAADLSQWESTIAFTADLMMRMTAHEAEMAATIHYVAVELTTDAAPPAEASVLSDVMKWKAGRRPAWNEVDVAVMIRNLAMLRVIHVRATDELAVDDEFLLGVSG
jgi:uncharacterized protein YwgA/O-acetyl-ADP-ribose deacetylase (regulator of RNase III)